MSHPRVLAARLLPAAALLLLPAALAAPPAAAAPAYVTGYHYYAGYSDNPSLGSTADVSFHATNSYSQVWLNGSVSCQGNNARITWCGWTGNGTNDPTAGVNYTTPGGGTWWYRIKVLAPVWYGNVECLPEGNAGVRVITYCP